MTGGHPDARHVNESLALAAERHGVAMGLGSQRAALRDPGLVDTYAIAREVAPTAPLFANVGISQLLDQDGESALSATALADAIGMIRADALVIHLNYLEESIQPEGQTRAVGALDAIASVAASSSVPIIAKETGAGISRQVALRLRDAGVAAIDVGGFGGTSFALIEAERAERGGDPAKSRVGRTFGSWGIPTAVSVAECAGTLPLVATGGVRTGLDAAKAITLGATAVGIGRPLLQAALIGADSLDTWFAAFAREIRTAVFLTGGRRLTDLPRVPYGVTGMTADWLRARAGALAGTDAS
jgi:isopentenyl-diphosphate delta-isomerase